EDVRVAVDQEETLAGHGRDCSGRTAALTALPNNSRGCGSDMRFARISPLRRTCAVATMRLPSRRSLLRNLASAVVGFAALAILVSTASARAEVRGAYLEARNADLYAGSCAREAEGDGRDAIVAWQVESGDFGGVPPAGLSVGAVIRGESAPP